MNHDEREEALGEERASCPAEGETPWNRVITGEGVRIQTIPIIGQIEGHAVLPPPAKTTKYEHLLPELVLAEESEEGDGVLILINTVGGDVEAGLAIAEMIASLSKPTVSLVLGGGHSIGVPLAVSADKSFIVPSATMMLHPVRTSGLVIGVEQTFRFFDKMQDRIVSFVSQHSELSKEKMLSMVHNVGELVSDIGTVLDGKKAVEVGLMDRVGGISDALSALQQMIDATR